MSSFSASPSEVPQDCRKVRVTANFGSLFGWRGLSVPVYDASQNMLPYPLQQLDVATPIQFYQPPVLQLPTIPNTYTALPTDNLYYPNYLPPSLIPSREATPSSTTSTTPDIYSAIHSHSINYIPEPNPQQFLNMNEVVATQQVAPVTSVKDRIGESARSRMHRAVKNTTTAGPIRGTSRNQRPTPYTRPAASTSSSETINLGSGFILSATAMSRLAHQTTCKIGGCGELFTSGDAYQVHVREDHLIMRGKSGSHRFPCPWEGCTEFKTKATLSNHLLGHNTRSGCNLCDVTMGVRSDSVQKHYRHCHKDTHANVSITSANRADYSYLFFTG